MASLLHMLPFGSTWFQWDRKPSAQEALGILAQDASNVIILGESGSGKTALSFQAAVSMAADNRRVMFVRPQVLSHLPLSVHGMPTPEARALELVKLWYPDKADELITWCANVHLHPVLPEAIVIDDFDYYVGQTKEELALRTLLWPIEVQMQPNPPFTYRCRPYDKKGEGNQDHEHEAARLSAVLVDAASFIASKSGKCHMIITASTHMTSLLSVLHQFHFSFMRIHCIVNEGPQKKCQLTTTVRNRATITATYTMTAYNIQLDTADLVLSKS